VPHLYNRESTARELEACMNNKSKILLLATLGAAALAACGSAPPSPAASGATQDQTAGQSAAPVAAHSPANAAPGSAPAANAAAPGSAGIKAFIDPVTGELRTPTDAERAQAEAGAAGTASVKVNGDAAAPVTVRTLSDGTKVYDLGDRAKVDEKVCVQPDGTVSGRCPNPPK
jgi:hypothetical protein